MTHDSEFYNKIKYIGEKIGYGEMMNICSALWRKRLKDKGFPESGAFIPTGISLVKEEHVKLHKRENKRYDDKIDFYFKTK